MTKHRLPEFRQPRICHCGDHGFVGLTRGLVALIGAQDVQRISGSLWSALSTAGTAYARSVVGGQPVLMHRLLTGAPTGLVVDHINHDTIDNRPQNLRVCTQAQNLHNARAVKKTSHFRGVHRDRGKWASAICRNGVRRHLGYFETEDQAAEAYRSAAGNAHA